MGKLWGMCFRVENWDELDWDFRGGDRGWHMLLKFRDSGWNFHYDFSDDGVSCFQSIATPHLRRPLPCTAGSSIENVRPAALFL